MENNTDTTTTDNTETLSETQILAIEDNAVFLRKLFNEKILNIIRREVEKWMAGNVVVQKAVLAIIEDRESQISERVARIMNIQLKNTFPFDKKTITGMMYTNLGMERRGWSLTIERLFIEIGFESEEASELVKKIGRKNKPSKKHKVFQHKHHY